jgi:acetate kinase
MGGVDAIVFTAGFGENAKDVRESVMKDMEFLGAKIDEKANDIRGEEREINTPDSKVKIFIIPTNEELVIARDTKRIVNNN